MSEQPIVYRSYGEDQEIEALRKRIEDLEKGRRPALPRHVVSALEEAIKAWGDDREQIAWEIPQKMHEKGKGEHWKVLYDHANLVEGGFFDLIDALRYGYTVEPPTEFTPSRKMDESEIWEVRRLYRIAMDKKRNGDDPDGFAFEALDKAILYLGGIELIADIKEGGADE